MNLHPSRMKNDTIAYCKQMILYKRTLEKTWPVIMDLDPIWGLWQISALNEKLEQLQ